MMLAPALMLSLGDVLVSNFGNRWFVESIDIVFEPDGVRAEIGIRYAQSQVISTGPFPAWAARVERGGAVIWMRTRP